MLKLIVLGVATVSLCFSSLLRAEVPRVVVSIAPLHSLASAVMEGVAEPELLLDGNASPHHFMLKPSQARALNDADVVLWVGPSVEGFLQKPMRGRAEASLMLIEQKDMYLLEARNAGVWQGEHDDHGHHHRHDHEAGLDGHLWLDPRNAMAAVRALVKRLSALDAANQRSYQLNGERLIADLHALDLQLAQQLKAVQAHPYLVFHDAYHYFEHRYGLNAVGALTIDPDRRPGAKRLRQIRQRIASEQVQCVFSEPQFSPSAVAVVLEGTGARSGVLDPAGADLAPGPELYFQLMRNLAEDLADCLTGQG